MSDQARRSGPMVAVAIAVLIVVAGVVGAAIWRTNRTEPAADPGPSTSLATSPSATVDPAAQEATEKLMAAYKGFRDAYTAAAATSDSRNADLAKYVADPLLTEARFSLQQQGQQGIITQGEPTSAPRVTTVNLSKRPYSATIEDCFDQSNWRSIYKATGKPAAAASQATRYIITSTALLYDDGRWLITESKADRSRPC